MKTITIVNQKGGVGKTTTALALSAGLRLRGYKVLCIDLDPQRNMSYTHGAMNSAVTVLDVLTGGKSADDAITETALGDLIPSSALLSSIDKRLTGDRQEYRLRDALETMQGNYDYIVIDTPPALGTLSVNALTASDTAIITAQADVFSLQGIGDLVETMRAVQAYTNPGLSVAGILLTRHNNRANLSKDVTDMIKQTADQMGTKAFNTAIRECIALKEAQAYQSDIFTYAPKSNAAEDYTAVLDELIKD